MFIIYDSLEVYFLLISLFIHEQMAVEKVGFILVYFMHMCVCVFNKYQLSRPKGHVLINEADGVRTISVLRVENLPTNSH